MHVASTVAGGYIFIGTYYGFLYAIGGSAEPDTSKRAQRKTVQALSSGLPVYPARYFPLCRGTRLCALTEYTRLTNPEANLVIAPGA